jgi:hypothetical protein
MKLGKLNILTIGLILLFISAFSGVDKTSAQQQFIRGDADGDCLVGVLDVVFVLCWYNEGGPSFPCMDAADANDNGVVDASDMVYLLQYIFIPGAPPLPPPFPNSGPDPTPDSLGCANACVAPANSAVDSLEVSSASGSACEVTAVPIIVTNSQALLAYQIHLEFDPNILEVTDVDTTGTATGAADPYEFDFPKDNVTGKLEISCAIDCARLVGIPVGRDTLVKIMFQVNQSATCTTTLLNLKTVTGPPFWGNLLDYAGGNVYPTLVDGNFTVQFKCGDATGDGVVDASDLVYLLNYLFVGGPPPHPLAAGDVTCDGIVDSSDLVYLLNYLFAHGPLPCGS